MSVLDADRRRITEIDARISELKAALSDLRGRKAIVQERLDSYKYPVLKLPPEIVSEIFTHFLPTYPDCPPLSGTLSPTQLTQICRTWREIALGTPLLWRAISLSPKDDLPPARLAQELDTWVRRSGCCPMAIDVDVPDSKFSSKRILELLTTIAAQHARLEHLVLHPDDIDSLLPFFGPMPRLRHLDLYLKNDNSKASTVLGFVRAPLLRTVVLTYNPVSVALPWAQLTSLTLRNIRPSDCSPVLKQARSLTSCDLLLVFDPDSFDLGPDITFRYLTSLTLDVNALLGASAIPAEYLHTFTVPSLRSLKIPEGFLGRDPVRALASFISKSGCKLQGLDMGGKCRISRRAYREAFPSINFSFLQR
ncbi:hypothetical protein C8R46DRAFT_1340781 [Mycena filopes]|nr:hypothetical protein C8R46DRAFT_1340781 [Mycena filopes]